MPVYQPLVRTRTIRLLHIEPGDLDEDIICFLKTYDLETAPAFEALSYVWGSTDLEAHILCNDVGVGITANLLEALRRLRPKKGKAQRSRAPGLGKGKAFGNASALSVFALLSTCKFHIAYV